MNGLDPDRSRRGFEKGRQLNKLVAAAGKDISPDAAGAIQFELRKTDPSKPVDIAGTVKQALKLFEKQQAESNRPRQTRPTAEQLSASNAAIQRDRPGREQYQRQLQAQKGHYLSPEGLKEGMDQMQSIPMAASVLAGLGLPAAIGGTALAKALTGAGISSLSSLPFYDENTTPSQIAFDAALGTLPAGGRIAGPALASSALLASDEAEASPRLQAIKALAQKLGIAGRYADSAISASAQPGSYITPLQSRADYEGFMQHTTPGGLTALLNDREAVAKAKRLGELSQPWDGTLPFRGSIQGDQDGNHRLLSQFLSGKPSLATVKGPNKLNAPEIFQPDDYSVLDQLDQFAKPGVLTPDQSHIFSMLTSNLLDNDMGTSALLYKNTLGPRVIGGVVESGHPDTGIPYLSEFTTLGPQGKGFGKEALQDILMQYRDLHITPTPNSRGFYLNQGAQPLEGMDLRMQAHPQKFASGGPVIGTPSDDNLNDDIMRDLLQIAAEKYHQLRPGGV